MANEVWKILIPQICKDFHDWKNRTCMNEIFQISFRHIRIPNDIQNKTYRFTGYREIKTLLIKVQSRSELKFFIDTFFGKDQGIIILYLPTDCLKVRQNGDIASELDSACYRDSPLDLYCTILRYFLISNQYCYR